MPGEGDFAKHFIDSFNCRSKLGPISSGSGHTQFLGINSVQGEDMAMRTNADDKLDALAEYSLQKHRRKRFDDDLNQMERSSFSSTIFPVEWIGTATSLIFF